MVLLIKWMTEAACLLLGSIVTCALMRTEIRTFSTCFLFYFLCYRSYIICGRRVGGSISYTPWFLGKIKVFIRNMGCICMFSAQVWNVIDFWSMLKYIMTYQRPSRINVPRRYCPKAPRKENVEQMEKAWAKSSSLMEVLRRAIKLGKKWTEKVLDCADNQGKSWLWQSGAF